MGEVPFSDPGTKSLLTTTTTHVLCWIKKADGGLTTVTQKNLSSATAVSFPQFGQQEYHHRQSEDLSEFTFACLCVFKFPWQTKWSWSKRTRPGRRPSITAERTTRTWSPSLTLSSRDGSKREPTTPPVPTSGWHCASPAFWRPGSGSPTRESTTRTGPRTWRWTTATCLEPWRQEDNTSGTKRMIWWSLISSALSFEAFLFSGGGFLLNKLTLCVFSGFIQLETKLVTKCCGIAENVYNPTCENLKFLYKNALLFLKCEWLS